jgi:hypothetical protein
MALLITIEAAFDVQEDDGGSTADLESIGEAIKEALEDLRSMGTARVSKAEFFPVVSEDNFAHQSKGLSEVDFILPKPTTAHIGWD